MFSVLRMNPFEVYQKYVALKLHFTSKTYDYFKYGGKSKASAATFDTRKDKYFFYKLSKRKDAESFLVANLIDNPDSWIGDLINQSEGEDTYVEWRRRQESLTYVFKTDLSKLNDDFNSNFEVVDGQHPRLLKLYLRKQICPETVVILNDLVRFIPAWDKKIDEQIIWPMIRNRLVKYKPFVAYDKEKYKQMVVDKFRDSE